MSDNYPQTAQGQAVPASNLDKSHDKGGITYPNLHRRIDNEITPETAEEVAPNKYIITVAAVNSYRTTEHTTHDEESSDSETP